MSSSTESKSEVESDPHVGNLVQSSNGQAADPGPDDKPKSIKDEVSLLSVARFYFKISRKSLSNGRTVSFSAE